MSPTVPRDANSRALGIRCAPAGDIRMETHSTRACEPRDHGTRLQPAGDIPRAPETAVASWRRSKSFGTARSIDQVFRFGPDYQGLTAPIGLEIWLRARGEKGSAAAPRSASEEWASTPIRRATCPS